MGWGVPWSYFLVPVSKGHARLEKRYTHGLSTLTCISRLIDAQQYECTQRARVRFEVIPYICRLECKRMPSDTETILQTTHISSWTGQRVGSALVLGFEELRTTIVWLIHWRPFVFLEIFKITHRFLESSMIIQVCAC